MVISRAGSAWYYWAGGGLAKLRGSADQESSAREDGAAGPAASAKRAAACVCAGDLVSVNPLPPLSKIGGRTRSHQLFLSAVARGSNGSAPCATTFVTTRVLAVGASVSSGGGGAKRAAIEYKGD